MKITKYKIGPFLIFTLLVFLYVPANLYALQGNVVLWNKLGSDQEALNSEIGYDFEIREDEGEVQYESGRFGNAIATTGGTAHTGPAGGYMAMNPDLFFPDDKTKGTVEFWINKQVEKLIPYKSPLLTFFGRQRYATGYNSIIGNWTDESPNRLAFGIYDGDGNWHNAYDDGGWEEVPVGQWVHLAFVWDGSGIDGTADDMRIYRDDVLVASHQGRFSEIKPNCCIGYNCGESYCDNGGYEVRVMAIHEGRRLTGCPQNLHGYCPVALMDNLIIWDYAKTDFSGRFKESPLPCTLSTDLGYTDDTLNMEFEVGTTKSARWRVFLVRWGVKKILISDRMIIDPPITLTMSIPGFESHGTIGILTTLTRGKDLIICSDFETVDTGQPEEMTTLEYPTQTVEELRWLFEEKLNEIMSQHPENVRYGTE